MIKPSAGFSVILLYFILKGLSISLSKTVCVLVMNVLQLLISSGLMESKLIASGHAIKRDIPHSPY